MIFMAVLPKFNFTKLTGYSWTMWWKLPTSFPRLCYLGGEHTSKTEIRATQNINNDIKTFWCQVDFLKCFWLTNHTDWFLNRPPQTQKKDKQQFFFKLHCCCIAVMTWVMVLIRQGWVLLVWYWPSNTFTLSWASSLAFNLSSHRDLIWNFLQVRWSIMAEQCTMKSCSVSVLQS